MRASAQTVTSAEADHAADGWAFERLRSAADPTGAQGKPASLTGGMNSRREVEMNQHRFAGNRKVRAKVRNYRSEFTIETLDAAAKTRDQLADIIQEPYGISDEEAARELDGFLDRNLDSDLSLR